jgi:hypothetical protein
MKNDISVRKFILLIIPKRPRKIRNENVSKRKEFGKSFDVYLINIEKIT